MNYKETLENAKTGLSDLRDYAVDGIKSVCGAFGPRPCGEESDVRAQMYMLDSIKKYSDEAWRETFKVNPDAFMSFVPIAGVALLGAGEALEVLIRPVALLHELREESCRGLSVVAAELAGHETAGREEG